MSQTKYPYIYVVLLCISIQILGLTTTLQYEGNAVFEGQYWRLISAHFSHLSWFHLSQNMAALLLLVYLLPCLTSTKALSLVLLISGLAITGMYYLFFPLSISYTGLSGCLHALAAFGILKQIFGSSIKNARVATTLAFLLSVKLGYEAFAINDTSIATEAHLIGAISGLFLAICFNYSERVHLLWRRTLRSRGII